LKRIDIIAILILISYLSWFVYCNYHTSKETEKEITFRGFGWYGYLADDKINEDVLETIKELGGNSVNINVYYEYNIKNENFILLSNFTKIEEKINLTHQKGLKVFLSPFANLVGGHYTGGSIEKPEKFFDGAKNISINLGKLAQKNNVEIYAVWNELGLTVHKVPNSTDITNKWLQDVRKEVRKYYKGILTTKEGVQFDMYEQYNFSEYDCIGVTFYPFTTSFAQDPYTNFTYAGVENLEEYERIVRDEYDNLANLKKKFNSSCIILGEIGVDVVGNKFIRNNEESNRMRAKAYEIVLKNGKDKIDGFFFSKFEHENGGSEELNEVFRNYFEY
jgi:hypothetical protein